MIRTRKPLLALTLSTAVVGLTVWFHLGLSAPVEREASVPVGVPA